MAATFVQGTGVQSVGSVASLSKAFGSNVTSGNLLVVGGVGNNETSLTTSSATDTRSTSYTRDANLADPGAPATQVAIYSGQCGSSGACTVTLDPTGSDVVSIGIAEFSGMATSTPLETQNTGNGSSNSAATGNLVTGQNTAIVGVVSHNGATSTLTEGGTYTLIFKDTDATDMPISWIYKIVASGTYTATWTIGGSSTAWVCAAAAYKEAAASDTLFAQCAL